MFCSKCGKEIDDAAIVCPMCGVATKNFEESKSQPQIIINNANTNSNVNQNTVVANGKAKNKWVSLILCILLGYCGAHKFYEGKVGMGILYLFTGGLFVIGVIVDFIRLLGKPNPYYV